MSASACIVYYGLRFDIPPNAVGALLEGHADQRIIAAKEVGLRCYWANFGAPGERYLLFVGAQLGILGPENSSEIMIELSELMKTIQSTDEKLRRAGLAGQPQLHVQWEEDD
jgi:hypothetical protein